MFCFPISGQQKDTTDQKTSQLNGGSCQGVFAERRIRNQQKKFRN
jgi:hypothetical protein